MFDTLSSDSIFDGINKGGQFIAEILFSLLDVVSSNRLLRIAVLIPVVTSVILVILWFFNQIQGIDFGQGRGLSSMYKAYPLPYYRYSKNKKPMKIDDKFKKQELSQAQKTERLQRELIRKQKQDDYLKRNDEIRNIESQLDGVNPKYRRAVAEQIYRNKIRLVAKYAQRTVSEDKTENFDDTDEY